MIKVFGYGTAAQPHAKSFAFLLSDAEFPLRIPLTEAGKCDTIKYKLQKEDGNPKR